MAANNVINVDMTSSGWTLFTTTITATTTSPTLGAGSTTQSYYLQVGKILYVKFIFTNVSITGATSGSGTYLFNIPSGFTINSSIVTFSNPDFAMGSSIFKNGSGSVIGFGIVTAHNSTNYKIMMYTNGVTAFNFLSSTYLAINNATLYSYSASVQVPIN